MMLTKRYDFDWRRIQFDDAMLIVGRSDDDKEKPQDIVDKD